MKPVKLKIKIKLKCKLAQEMPLLQPDDYQQELPRSRRRRQLLAKL